jgi:hypothetical protein
MFHVGQKVCCVNEPCASQKAKWPGSNWPAKGAVYKIRAINVWPAQTLLRLEEVDNRHFEGVLSAIEPGFPSEHFRPIVERKTDISIFTAMLTPQNAPGIETVSTARTAWVGIPTLTVSLD